MAKAVEVRAQFVSEYGGHNCKSSGAFEITLCTEYGELTNVIQTLQMLSNDVRIGAKLPGQAQMKLGTFRIKKVTIDGDGTAKVLFNSEVDSVEINNINNLVTKERFQVRLVADVELEDGESEDEWSGVDEGGDWDAE